MFILKGAQTTVRLTNQADMESTIAGLAMRGYISMVRSIVGAFCEVASLPLEIFDVESLYNDPSSFGTAYSLNKPLGDIFFRDNHVFLLQQSRNGLQAWEIRQHTSNSELIVFCSEVERAVTSTLSRTPPISPSFLWDDIKIRSPLLLSLERRKPTEHKLDKQSPAYDESDLMAAKLLACPEYRDAAGKLAKATKTGIAGAIPDLNQSLLENLAERGIARKEFSVQCKQDSRPLFVVQDRNELENLTQVCSVCRRRVNDELIKEIYAITERGKSLLNHSHWMTIWITDLLVEAGIDKTLIGWNATSGEDELDIVITLFDSQVFFELKDREFGLGDAYPFVSRVARYGGNIGVVASTEKVALEAKKFVDEQLPNMQSEIEFMEGTASIERSLSDLIDRLSRKHIYNLISEFGSLYRFNFVPLLRAWMDNVRMQTKMHDSSRIQQVSHR